MELSSSGAAMGSSSLPFPHQLPTASAAAAAAAAASAPHNGPGASAASSPGPLPAAKRRRTSSAASLSNCCRTCRLRKVKCTGNPGNGPCLNCVRLELTCPFVEDAGAQSSDKISRIKPSQNLTEAGTLRKRAQRACSQCHSQKTKCSGDLPQCKRCESVGLNCEYLPAKRKFTNVRLNKAGTIPEESVPTTPSSQSPNMSVLQTPTPTPAPTAMMPVAPPPMPSTTAPADVAAAAAAAAKLPSPPPKPESKTTTAVSGAECKPPIFPPPFPLSIDVANLTAEDLLLRKTFLLRHLDAYFDNLYWFPCLGFFHPDTAYRQVYEGTFDPPTATALCAVSSFFVNHGSSGNDFRMKCLDDVEFFVFRNLHKFSGRMLMPYALILCFNYLNGSFAKVWQCFGLAVRLMMGLQLNWDFSNRGKSFHQQELVRRLSWQIFVMDRLLAGGYEEYISCRAEIMRIRLPCVEDAFWENKPIMSERLRDRNTKCQGMGLHALNVRLTDLLHRIQSWTKRLAQPIPLEPSKIMEDISNWQNELTRFHASIPDDIRLSDTSIAKYMASTERVGFVYFHTHLSVSHIDLYRFALPGILDSSRNNILRRLPQAFIDMARKQAVAHALCTGRFCVAIQDVVDRLPSNGRLRLAGDCTISHMVTQTLRVFLIAMQHKIYDNITDNTTAPLWRYQEPNEEYIRGLIDNGLFRISEPWCDILMTGEQAHANNKAMLAEFDRTRKFADQKGTVGFSGSKPSGGVTRLPGPHYILENANHGVIEEDRRTKASAAAAADRWFKGPKQDEEADMISPLGGEGDFVDTEYGPPGIPMLLAVARNAGSDQPKEDVNNIYDLEMEAMALMQERMWLNGGMMPPDHGGGQMVVVPSPSGLPVMQQMGATDPGMMFQPPPPLSQPPPPPSQHQQQPSAPAPSHTPSAQTGGTMHGGPPPPFIPPPGGMYMGEYAPHHQYPPEANGAPNQYMPQNNYR